MAAPLAKGLIITASVLVAAGIAISQNEHIREWILNYRRKLAMALHSLGDEIHPPSRSRSGSQSDDDEEALNARRRRREEIVRLNRLEMIRQARQEGIAVDLDELVKLGQEEENRALKTSMAGNVSTGFDALVGSDGKLRHSETSYANGTDIGSSGMRQRGVTARSSDSDFPLTGPLDDVAPALHNSAFTGALGYEDDTQQSREILKTISPAPMEPESAQSQYFSEDEMDAQIDEAIRRSLHDHTGDIQRGSQEQEAMDMDPPISVPSNMKSSFYYAPPPNLHQPPVNAQSLYSSAMEAMMEANLHHVPVRDAGEEAQTPTGTLTPTEDGQSTAASLIGSQAEDIGRMSDFHSMIDDNEMDARSEATSEAYSMVGASTPGSWTDVESEAGDEEGHHVTSPPHATHV